MTLRRFLITSFFCFGALVVGACGAGLKIKIYRTDPSKGGLYREQDKELVKWQDAGGFYCTDTAGMRKLTEAYALCKDLINDE